MMDPVKRVEYSDLSEDWHDGRIYGPDGEFFTGECYENYRRTGNPELIAEYVDGVLHGVSRTWHENGQLATEDRHWRGRRHGVSRAWHENGALSFVSLDYGNFSLEWKSWDEVGKLLRHVKISPSEQSILEDVVRKSDYPPLAIPDDLPLDYRG